MIRVLYRAARDRLGVRHRNRHLVLMEQRVSTSLGGIDRTEALAAQLAEIRALPEPVDRRF